MEHEDLTQILNDIRKGRRIAAESIRTASESIRSDVRYYIHTGNPILDYGLGFGFRGGIPVGRITEIYGAQSDGKTTMGLHILGNAQRGKITHVEWVMGNDGALTPAVQTEPAPPVFALYIDTECSLDRIRATNLGVRLNDLVYLAPDTVEEAFELLDAFLQRIGADPKYSNAIIVVVFDTLAATPTEAEIKGTATSGGVAEKARLVKYYLRRFTGTVAAKQVAFVVLNQVMDRINVPGIEAPGGRGIRHHASYRLRLQRVGHLTMSTEIVGIESRLTITKSKLGPPGAQYYMPIRFDTGIDYRYCIFEFLHNEKYWKVDTKGKGQPPIQRGAWNTLHMPGNIPPVRFREAEWGDIYLLNEQVRNVCAHLVTGNLVLGHKDYKLIYSEQLEQESA